jgi:hypothetical protein
MALPLACSYCATWYFFLELEYDSLWVFLGFFFGASVRLFAQLAAPALPPKHTVWRPLVCGAWPPAAVSTLLRRLQSKLRLTCVRRPRVAVLQPVYCVSLSAWAYP